MEHSLRKHAKYGGSGAHRYMRCHGSVRLAETAPVSPPSRYSLDGTDAHELLDYALKHNIFNADVASATAGRLAQDTAPEAGDRLEAVQDALDYVRNILESYEGAEMIVEHSFKLPTHNTDEAWGICDILIHVPNMSMLFVIDYKHGEGEAVDVTDNEQLHFYGAGALSDPRFVDVETAVLVIIQPRLFHVDGRVREQMVTRARLMTFIGEVDMAVLACEAPNAPLNPGRKQCRWCPAKLVCPAIEAEAFNAAGQHFKSVKDVSAANLPLPQTLELERLVQIHRAGGLLRKYLDDCYDALLELAKRGVNIPGMKLVETTPRREWYGEPEEITRALMRLADTNDWDLFYPRTIVGITKAETTLRKAFKGRSPKQGTASEQAAKAMATLTIKKSTGNHTLVDESDGRQPVNLAETAFASVQLPPPPEK